MRSRLLLVILPFLVWTSSLYAQDSKVIDSLGALLTDADLPDSTRILAQSELAYELQLIDLDSSRKLAETALDQAQILAYTKGAERALGTLGFVYQQAGDLEASYRYLSRAAATALRIGDGIGWEKATLGFGYYYLNQGLYDSALIKYRELAQVQEARGATTAIDYTYNSIGEVFRNLGNYEAALPYYDQAIAIAQKGQNQYWEAFYLDNIGEVYTLMGRYTEALEKHQQALSLGEALNNGFIISWSSIAEGVALTHLGRSQEAIRYIRKGLPYAENAQDLYSLTYAYTYLGRTYRQLNRMEEAIAFGKQGVAVGQTFSISQYSDALKELQQSYAAAKDYLQAYETLQLFKMVSDSLAEEETSKTIAALEAQKLLEQERASFAEESLRQGKQISYLLYAGMISMVLFLAYVWRSLATKRRDNDKLQTLNREIQIQNEAVEAQNEEITQQRDQLQLAYENVELLGHMGKALAASLSMESLITTFIQEVGQLVDATKVGIGLFREEEQDLYFPFTLEEGEWFKDGKVSLEEMDRLAVQCFFQQKGIRTGNYEGTSQDGIDNRIPIMGKSPSRSIIYLPVTYQHKRLGVLTVQSNDKLVYQDYHMSLLQNLAVYVAIAVENIRTLQQMENLSLVARETTNPVVIAKANGKILWYNRSFQETYAHLNIEEFIRQQDGDMLSFIGSGRAKEAYLKILETKETQTLIMKDRLKVPGQDSWWQLAASPVLNEQGEIKKIIGVGSDITQLRNTQDQLQLLTDRLATINQIDKALLQSESLDQILETSTRALMKGLNASRVGISLFDFEQEGYVLRGVLNQEEAPSRLDRGQHLPIHEFNGIELLQENNHYQVDDLSEKSELSYTDQILLEEGHRSYLSYPLIAKETLIGALTVCFQKVAPFSEEVMDIIQEVASGVGLSIAHFRLQDDLKRNHRLLAAKNRDVVDSIAYAEKIQKSVLQTEHSLTEMLPEHFLLNKAKDLVSGDFYWVEEHQGKMYVAVADCTGHGVPGAIMSVVCSNSLTESLQSGIESTGQLLEKTRDRVIQRLSNSGQELTDGMDISLCAFDLKQHTLEWSGAYNPLLIINPDRKETPTGAYALDEIPGTYEWKGNRQPIGLSKAMDPFTSHVLDLHEKDMVYLFTDGFQDQFGGPMNKKYLAKRLKRKLWEIHHHTPERQKEILEQEFDTWRGTQEQVDDVCLMGLRIELA
ncbi:MAG: tetratricopeptide repeat protein [Bacteroidota bacterium]